MCFGKKNNTELEKRIKYYNKTFSDAPGEVLGVMENRLATRGITL